MMQRTMQGRVLEKSLGWGQVHRVGLGREQQSPSESQEEGGLHR